MYSFLISDCLKTIMLEIGLIKFILYLFRPNIQIDSGSQFVRMNRQRRSTPRVDDCNIFRFAK